MASLVITSDLLHYSHSQSCRVVCVVGCGDSNLRNGVMLHTAHSCSQSVNLSERVVVTGNKNSSEFTVAFLQAATVLTVKHWTVDLTSLITLLVNSSEHLQCLRKTTSLQTNPCVSVCVCVCLDLKCLCWQLNAGGFIPRWLSSARTCVC